MLRVHCSMYAAPLLFISRCNLAAGACSNKVRPRWPLGRDPDMDYEVMSDEEWEEEPEGEAVDGPDAEDEDEEAVADEDGGEGFMVAGAAPSKAAHVRKVLVSVAETCCSDWCKSFCRLTRCAGLLHAP